MRIQKGKLCGKTLKTYQVWNKSNFDNIFESYLGYNDLEGLCNSPHYFERLLKNLFAIVHQQGLPTFIVTFTSTERLWDFFIKILHTLHASRLNLPNKIKDLQLVRITKLIQINFVTCIRYITTKKHLFSTNLLQKIILFLGIYT